MSSVGAAAGQPVPDQHGTGRRGNSAATSRQFPPKPGVCGENLTDTIRRGAAGLVTDSKRRCPNSLSPAPYVMLSGEGSGRFWQLGKGEPVLVLCPAGKRVICPQNPATVEHQPEVYRLPTAPAQPARVLKAGVLNLCWMWGFKPEQVVSLKD